MSSRTERAATRIAHLASARCVFDVVFRSTASLDITQVQLLVQDLDLRGARRHEDRRQR